MGKDQVGKLSGMCVCVKTTVNTMWLKRNLRSWAVIFQLICYLKYSSRTACSQDQGGVTQGDIQLIVRIYSHVYIMPVGIVTPAMI